MSRAAVTAVSRVAVTAVSRAAVTAVSRAAAALAPVGQGPPTRGRGTLTDYKNTKQPRLA